MVATPSCIAETQLASAVPCVSWKWTAMLSSGASASTRSSTCSTCHGLATPIVSLIDTW